MAAPPTEHEILDVNRRYHDVAAESYDAKWGISFGEIGHQQVLGKLTKLLGPRPGPFARSLEIGAGTGYFSLNLLQTGVVARGDVHGHQPRACSRRSSTTRRELGLEVETAACDARRAAVRGRELRPRARARRPAPPARPRPLLRGVQARAQARRDAVLRRRAVALGRPDRRACPSRPRWKLAPPWRRGDQGPPRARRHHGATDEDEHALEAVVDVHAFVPADLAAPRGRRRLHRRARAAARSCWRTGSAGSTARWRPAPSPRTSRGAGSSTPTAATSCSSAWTASCSSRACRRGSSTT